MEIKMLELYRSVMDSNVNPLRNLPPAQRFQIMMFLSVMWTTIFCAIAGAWMWYGELMIVHLLVVLGFFITGLTFHRASKVATYRDQSLDDGTARYDDVWGA